ncbi:spore germination protein [Paenibacillus sedimenti]|uniref:Spore germination protein n=1 Tax=Paenibacillus sedimenti TaxID=2770274 RepID=A0A926KW27_9BACL|nr:spore germination protein [Paenibacillus sedimenti]MBD0383174.1 spore germination protein [Paenibacillus sedimenti]
MKHILKRWMTSPRHKELIQELQRSFKPAEDLNESLGTTMAILEEHFANCSDVVFQPVKWNDCEVLLVYVEGMVDLQFFAQLLQAAPNDVITEEGKPCLSLAERLEQIRTIGTITPAGTLDELVKGVFVGNVAILADGERSLLINGMGKTPERKIAEPEAETLIRGPREGFIEQLQTNLIMLRRRLPTPHFKMESLTLGKLTQTKVVMAYIDGIATDSVVQEVRNRVSSIDIDGIVDSGYIEEFIEDMPYSPFPQVQNTERPDVVVGNLLEGKIAVLASGSPSALLVPLTFWGGLQSSEDYYERYMIGTFFRWIRFLLFVIALFLPSLYVAISTFHQEMIPTNLLLTIAGAREANPFPALVEALLMEITFEALREAGVRLPKQVGSAVSIVGVLVIGEAAVQAGIVSTPMVIVVSITGIASFAIPRFNMQYSVRVLRFPLIILGGTLGLFGIGIGFLGILIHLSSLRSFGIPYFSPIAPVNFGGLRDVLIRAPHWNMKLRPRLTGYQDPVRVPQGQKPGPDRDN